MYVIGTAGHVDHGKSALVQALTGIDPDRLREEKERGLTIDLGFAWLTLPGGGEVSIVDVPGHERFIKNMLAGVGGIDLALLVIAADEGVMPQTREHLAIIDLLGINRGVVALTKSDLVESEFLGLVRAEAEQVLRGTSLEGAPIVACSAVKRTGLDELVSTLEAELARTPAKRDIGRPRLPIDRIFTMPGFGTVVTGTLIDGSLRAGDEVEIVPGSLRSRIRGLQSHGRKVEVASPGRRTAVNLASLAVADLRRGMVVCTPTGLKPTTAVDARMRAVGYLNRPIRHNLSVTFHTGSAEVEGKVLLLDREEAPPGETAWAQIRLAEPVAALRGDRFIIRDSNDTLGGGRIVDTNVARHRRFHAPTLAALELLERGSPEELLTTAVARSAPAELRDVIRRVEIGAEEARDTLRQLVDAGEMIALDGRGLSESSILYTRSGFEALAARIREMLAAFHEQAPLRRGIPREELRSRLGMPQRAFDGVIARLAAQSAANETGGTVALPDHAPSPTKQQTLEAGKYLASLQANPFAPTPATPLDDELLAYLEDAGEIVRMGDGVAFARGAYREMVDRVVAHLREHKAVTLAQVRDMFGTSRKFAQALLEHMDEERITRRVGDERLLR